MHPILIDISGFIIPSWHVFVALGGIAGYLLLIHLGRDIFTERDLKRAFSIAYISGLLGARWFTILLQESPQGFTATLESMFTMGAMTFYGGALGGGIAIFLFANVRGLSLRSFLDISIPPLLLGLAFGRIGCFLNGDDFGIAYPDQINPPWWASINPVLSDGISRYPVQIFETIAASLITIGLVTISHKRPQAKGLVGAIGLCAYGISRFFLEYYRGDDRGPSLAGLSPSQAISLVIIALGLSLAVTIKVNSGNRFR